MASGRGQPSFSISAGIQARLSQRPGLRRASATAPLFGAALRRPHLRPRVLAGDDLRVSGARLGRLLEELVLEELLLQLLDALGKLRLPLAELLHVLHLLLSRVVHLAHELLLGDVAQLLPLLTDLRLYSPDEAHRLHAAAWDDVLQGLVAAHQVVLLQPLDGLVLRHRGILLHAPSWRGRAATSGPTGLQRRGRAGVRRQVPGRAP
mmetsp:Transcript_73792/g.193560  ORF Transcript_73792/g.193560 Transcript_73792/m.193560 type:complete len:207 (+) Transcript_73792:49-669(+)